MYLLKCKVECKKNYCYKMIFKKKTMKPFVMCKESKKLLKKNNLCISVDTNKNLSI